MASSFVLENPLWMENDLMPNISVSVVIPTYDSVKTLRFTLEALSRQTYFPIEIIVVDDGSLDDTAKMVRLFSAVRYIHQDNAGPACARNTGALAATSDIIFFTDADCVPHVDWIEKAMKAFDAPDVAAVAGSYGIVNKENMLARCVHQEILYRHQRFMLKETQVFGSYNVGICKKVFDEVGGFDVGYRRASGEDNALSYAIIQEGYRIRFAAQALVAHVHPSRIGRYLKEQYRHGFWRARMYRDYPKMICGDGYTFWKDSLEIVLAGIVLLGVLGGIWLGPVIGVFGVLGMMALELGFACLMVKPLVEKFFWAFIMAVRAFARLGGFLFGLINLIYKK